MTSPNEKTHPSTPGSKPGGSSTPIEGAIEVSHDNQWNEKVQRGRVLVSEISDRKWELGDLANEVVPAGVGGNHTDGLLEKFAAEIGIAANTLRNYRHVANKWPAVTRVTAQTWTTHRQLAERDDRFDIIAEQTWTYNSLSDRLGRLPNPSRQRDDRDTEGIASPLTPGQIAEAIKGDVTLAQTAATALRDSGYQQPSTDQPSEFQKMAHQAKSRDAAADSQRGGMFAEAEFSGKVGDAQRAVKAAINLWGDRQITGEWAEFARNEVARLKALVELLESTTAGDRVDWDAELARLAGDVA